MGKKPKLIQADYIDYVRGHTQLNKEGKECAEQIVNAHFRSLGVALGTVVLLSVRIKQGSLGMDGGPSPKDSN